MKSSPLFSSLVIAALGLTGCASADSAVGELGNGVFRYRCDSATRHCVDGSAAQFPRSVALGSRFALSYGRRDERQSLSVLQAVSSQQLQGRAGSFQAMTTGLAGILSLDRGGRVEDYTFVDVLAPGSVEVWVKSGGSQVGSPREDAWQPSIASWSPSVGETLPVMLLAKDSFGEELAGESVLQLQCAPALLGLVPPSEPELSYALRALEAGQASCELRGYEKNVRFDVQVSGEANPDAGGAPEADAGADASDVGDLELEGGAL